jgi:hypothetical protein
MTQAPRADDNKAGGHAEGFENSPESHIKAFLQAISGQAVRALNAIGRPGLLQLSRLHPTQKKLVPTRYVINDVDGMVKEALSASAAGHNIYVEARTVRATLSGASRGKLADTVRVFAFVIDSDADKGMAWTPPPGVQPSLVVETSPGNRHYWFFLEAGLAPELAKALGDRIRAAAGADHDTANPVQPYRVAGTTNYPSPEKVQRGRTTTPTRLVEQSRRIWECRAARSSVSAC